MGRRNPAQIVVVNFMKPECKPAAVPRQRSLAMARPRCAAETQACADCMGALDVLSPPPAGEG